MSRCCGQTPWLNLLSSSRALFPAAILFGALAACNGPQLGASQALDADPLLRDLPADTTFLASANLRLLRQSLLFHAWLEAAGTDLDRLERSLQVSTGLQAGAEALGDLRIGCGSDGCAGLIAGDLSGYSTELTASTLNHVAERAGVKLMQRVGVEQAVAAKAARSDLRVRLPHGEPMALRLIAPDRALFGDQKAITAATEPDAPDLDLSVLAGAVPAGDVWIAMHDANLMFEQMAKRFELIGTDEARQMAERLRARTEAQRNAADMVAVVAFALDSGDPTTARARATCRNATAAVAIEQMARAALLRVEVAGATETVRRAAADTKVVRVGKQVEISLTWPAADVLAALEEAREVRP